MKRLLHKFTQVCIIVLFLCIGSSPSFAPPQEEIKVTYPEYPDYPKSGLEMVQNTELRDYLTGIINNLIHHMNDIEREDAIKENRSPRILKGYKLQIFHNEHFKVMRCPATHVQKRTCTFFFTSSRAPYTL